MGRDILTRPAPDADERVRYGDDANQFVDFRFPRTAGERPLVIIIHGGFWRNRYDLLYAGNACHALTGEGFPTANIEYRRVGQEGGGWRGTLDDALAAVMLARGRISGPAIVMGHSAGGHLALYAGGEFSDLAGVVGLGAVASLRLGWERNIGDGAVHAFVGGGPAEFPERYAAADPVARASAVPRVLIHGTADDIVPVELSREYVKARAGDTNAPKLEELAGVDHFDVIDPLTETWNTVERVLEGFR